MIRLTLLVTVGISLVTNFSKSKEKKELPSVDELVEFIKEQGKAASAEVNSIERIMEKLREYKPDETLLVLIISETKEAQLCADALIEYFKSKGFKAVKRVVEGLKYEEKEFAERGLYELVNVLSDEIANHKHEKRRVVVCATGGFKPEVAYATIVAFLNKVEVFYIHELFKDVVALEPLIPLSVPESFWNKYGRLLDYLKLERDYDEAKEKFPNIDEERVKGLISVYEENGKKKVRLSPLGLALIKAKENLI